MGKSIELEHLKRDACNRGISWKHSIGEKCKFKFGDQKMNESITNGLYSSMQN